MGLVACSLTVGVGYALSGSGDDARTRSGATTVSEAPEYGKGDTVPAPGASETAGPSASASPSTSASASPSASASGTPAGAGAPSASRTASDEKTAAHTKGTTSRQSEQRTTAPRPSRTASAPRPSSPDTGTGGGGGDASLARQVADLANQERAKAGCAPLRVDSRLQAAAQAHADDMAARNYYEHTSPEGKSAGDRMEAAGYDWRTWGENIHKSPKDARTAMRDWMDSPGHRENILNCEFKDLGVGVNLSSNGPWWVQNFGAGS
ncbi:CAP domain-containing protein [Streptomyces sp. HNM0663]|uniref:CAP domain-containing protein n=1 Tax=Streptomyces chengmaiensis TaxID=3040919 RepID=A0ABT6HQJ8_9ACTN|nr:CAP domain-containing protein [Streptomyces chengmaiensis]MDH2390981.1 CAP domain-containing protein [Streptomyces chengmaiensis]